MIIIFNCTNNINKIKGNFCILSVSNLLVGSVYHVKNQGCLLEVFIMSLFNRTLSIHSHIFIDKDNLFRFSRLRSAMQKLASTIADVSPVWNVKEPSIIRFLLLLFTLTLDYQVNFTIYLTSREYF